MVSQEQAVRRHRTSGKLECGEYRCLKSLLLGAVTNLQGIETTRLEEDEGAQGAATREVWNCEAFQERREERGQEVSLRWERLRKPC